MKLVPQKNLGGTIHLRIGYSLKFTILSHTISLKAPTLFIDKHVFDKLACIHESNIHQLVRNLTHNNFEP